MVQPRTLAPPWAVGLAVLVGTGVACSPPEPLVLDPAPRPAPVAAPAAAAAPGCRIHFLQVTDQRRDKATLGVIGDRPVKAPADTGAWLAGILQGLAVHGVAVTLPGAEAVPEGSLQAEAELVSAWVSSIATSKTASVVLRIRYRIGDGPADQRLYRGSRTTVNWASGDGEVRRFLAEAFDDALGKVAADARLLAGPTRPGGGS